MAKQIEITCPTCDGEGIVWYIDDIGIDGGMMDHEETCPECDGDGTILIDDEDAEEEETDF